MDSNNIPHDICQELIDIAASALNIDSSVLEDTLIQLNEFNPIEVLDATSDLNTSDVATIRALLEGDKVVDKWLEEIELDKVG